MAKRDFAQVHTPAKKVRRERTPVAMVIASLSLTGVLAFAAGYMVGDTRNSTQGLKLQNQALQQRVDALQKQAGDLQQQLASSLERHKPVPKKAAAERVGDLTFYSELPKQKVMPTPLGDTGPAARQKHHGENIDAYADLPPPSKDSQRPDVVHPVDAASLAQSGGGVVARRRSTASPSSTGEAAGSPTATYRLQVGSFVRQSDAEALLNRMLKAGIRGIVRSAQVPNLGTRYRVFTMTYTGMAEAEGGKALLRDKLGIRGLLMRE